MRKSLEDKIEKEEKVKSTFAKTKKLFRDKKEKTLDYFMTKDKEISKYFSKDLPKETRERYEGVLRSVVDREFEKYDQYLKSWYNRSGKIVGGLLSLYNAWQMFITNLPLPSSYFGSTHAVGVLTKAFIEIPLLYKYIKTTKDMSAIPKWVGYKLIETVPLIGPLIGYKGLDNIITSHAKKNIKFEFLKSIKKYTPLEELIEKRRKKLKIPASVSGFCYGVDKDA